jgi:hypothetical protein
MVEAGARGPEATRRGGAASPSRCAEAEGADGASPCPSVAGQLAQNALNTSGRNDRTRARSGASRTAWWMMALSASVCAHPASATAKLLPIPTRLDWVTTVCGDDEGFAARVLQRTKMVRFVGSGARFTVRLSIEQRGTALEARVRIEGPDGPETVRQIASPNCDDALDALALVVAISLEARATELKNAKSGRRAAPTPSRRRSPDAATVEPAKTPGAAPETPAEPVPADHPAPEEPSPSAPSAAAPEPSAPSSPAERTPPRTGASSAAAVRAAPATPSGTPRESTHGWTFGAGISALLSIGVAPRPLFGGELRLRSSWERDGAVSPEASLGLSHQRLDGFRRPGGEADFALTVANLEVCPLRLDVPPLGIRPCATASAGQLNASGHQTFSAAALHRPWVAFGGSLQFIARLGPLELRASVGAAGPLDRDSFRFGGPCVDSCEGEFHRVEHLIWTGALGVGF